MPVKRTDIKTALTTPGKSKRTVEKRTSDKSSTPSEARDAKRSRANNKSPIKPNEADRWTESKTASSSQTIPKNQTDKIDSPIKYDEANQRDFEERRRLAREELAKYAISLKPANKERELLLKNDSNIDPKLDKIFKSIGRQVDTLVLPLEPDSD